MVRVPNTRATSRSDGGLTRHPSWEAQSAADIDRFISQSRRAIRSHRRGALSLDVDKAEAALAAIEATQSLLRELLHVVSPDRRQEIEMILERE